MLQFADDIAVIAESEGKLSNMLVVRMNESWEEYKMKIRTKHKC